MTTDMRRPFDFDFGRQVLLAIALVTFGGCASNPPPAPQTEAMTPSAPTIEPAPPPPAVPAPLEAAEATAGDHAAGCQVAEDCARSQGESPVGMHWSCDSGTCVVETSPTPAAAEQPAPVAEAAAEKSDKSTEKKPSKKANKKPAKKASK